LASFFENQQLARRNTKLLVPMFALAVAGVIVAVDLFICGLYAWNPLGGPETRFIPLGIQFKAVPDALYLWGAAGTAALIFAVSGWNVMQLSRGGAAVAEMVGARRVDPGTRDPLERRLVNVVEEMAIASGVRVPAVYVMDGERGINAFAAGYEVSDSIVAVTRGTLETLNRDELQGVVGHEFSHILNGDMRLNIRMIGVLAGIVFIGSVGEYLMRGPDGDTRGRGALNYVLGPVLLLIGYIGLFFARLIKVAVSRQREFLADASSVQFTRNPDGIAGALDQTRVKPAGSFIAGWHAEDLSHMYFGQGISVRMSGFFDTHPPVEERIQRVHSRFDRESYRRSRPPAMRGLEEGDEDAQGAREKRVAVLAAVLATGSAIPPTGRRGADQGAQWGRSATENANLVGSMDSAKVEYATRLLAALPVKLRETLHEAEGAAATLVALLLAPKEGVMNFQLEALTAAGWGEMAERARRAQALTRNLGAAFHMPVVDLALPAIKAAPEAAKQELLAALEAVIQADRRVSLHEFVVLTLLRNQLAPKGRPSAGGSRKIADLQFDALTVLSLIAHAGTRQDAAGARADNLQAAMRAGTKEMGLSEGPPTARLTLQRTEAALESLKQLAPLQKAVLVKGLFAAVTSNGTIRVAEAELMRLVGAVLDCPLPPLLESIDPAMLAA